MAISSNKRIAKNTLMLYVRLIIVLLVSLYTVRIVLKVLGVSDYGIFNVVAGVVTMFTFVSSTLSTATIRFFSFELGKDDYSTLNKVYNTSILFFIILALGMAALLELIGPWFIETKLNIPQERKVAAYWVFQFSILSFVINLLDSPFKSLIISYEKMNIYAYISILEVALKLGVIFVLSIVNYDKLILYAISLAASSLMINLAYFSYCRLNLEGSKIKLIWDYNKFKELFSFCGWTFIGALAGLLRSQGVNILLNIFFNPIVNAARGVAYQINHALSNFVLNFYTSFRPQVTKLYAAKEIKALLNIVILSSKVSFFLTILLSLPFLFEINFILNIWLTDVPPGTALFARLIIINAIIESLSYSLSSVNAASGNVKWYQIVTGGLILFNLPLSYVFFKAGFPPATTFEISITLTSISIFVRLHFVKGLIGLNLKDYFNDVISYVFKVAFAAVLLPLIAFMIIDDKVVRFIVVTCLCLSSTSASIYFLGLKSKERKKVRELVISYKNKILKRA